MLLDDSPVIVAADDTTVDDGVMDSGSDWSDLVSLISEHVKVEPDRPADADLLNAYGTALGQVKYALAGHGAASGAIDTFGSDTAGYATRTSDSWLNGAIAGSSIHNRWSLSRSHGIGSAFGLRRWKAGVRPWSDSPFAIYVGGRAIGEDLVAETPPEPVLDPIVGGAISRRLIGDFAGKATNRWLDSGFGSPMRHYGWSQGRSTRFDAASSAGCWATGVDAWSGLRFRTHVGGELVDLDQMAATTPEPSLDPILGGAISRQLITGAGLPTPSSRRLRLVDDELGALEEAEQIAFGADRPDGTPRRPRL